MHEVGDPTGNRRAIDGATANQKSRFPPPPPSVSIPMPTEKRSRKRQNTGKPSSSKSKKKLAALDDDDGKFEPLGSSRRVWDDEDKDDEERRLESTLFGRPYVPSTKRGTGGESDGDGDGMLDADIDLAGNEFANLIDSEVRRTRTRWRKRSQI